MEKRWFYYFDEKKCGPFTDEEVKSFFKEGIIQYHTLLWKEGMNQWLPGHKIHTFEESMYLPDEVKKYKKDKKKNKKMNSRVVVFSILIILIIVAILNLFKF